MSCECSDQVQQLGHSGLKRQGLFAHRFGDETQMWKEVLGTAPLESAWRMGRQHFKRPGPNGGPNALRRRLQRRTKLIATALPYKRQSAFLP